MAKAEKLLSVCIPTFNRAEKLDRLLGWLQEQVRGVESEVEICISSNGSTDNTAQVVAKWKRVLPIVYQRNPRNRGSDFNELAIMKMANGRFCWLVGDDDQPLPGAVKTLLKDIKSLGNRKVGSIYVMISHSFDFLGGQKFSSVPDGPFKVYSVAERKYPKLSLLHLALLCLHTKTAKEVIREKTYLDGDRICKRGPDPHVLHLWAQAYIFLECIRKVGFFALEPKSMLRLISDGDKTASYGKKMYADMASFNYIYDIRKHYPDFNGDFFAVRMMGHLLRVVMACENPRLERAYLATTMVFLKLLEMDNRRRDIRLVKALEIVRKIPLVPLLIPLAYRAFLVLRGRGNALRNYEEKNQEIAESLEFCTSNTERKFGKTVSG